MNDMEDTAKEKGAYEAPLLTVLGSMAELTLVCDKHLGGSDGFTFMGMAISCVST
jgi:hypothetical protein